MPTVICGHRKGCRGMGRERNNNCEIKLLMAHKIYGTLILKG
jgi:hypothetical protein